MDLVRLVGVQPGQGRRTHAHAAATEQKVTGGGAALAHAASGGVHRPSGGSIARYQELELRFVGQSESAGDVHGVFLSHDFHYSREIALFSTYMP